MQEVVELPPMPWKCRHGFHTPVKDYEGHITCTRCGWHWMFWWDGCWWNGRGKRVRQPMWLRDRINRLRAVGKG